VYGLSTPRRKKLARCLIRGKPSSMARLCFNHPHYCDELIQLFGKAIKDEIKTMCSENANSILKSMESSDLEQFTWQKVKNEAKEHAPIITSILNIVIAKSKPEKKFMIPFLIATLCNLHWSKMNLHLKVLSCLLYVGHCSKEVSLH
jgi:hypothetical protein